MISRIKQLRDKNNQTMNQDESNKASNVKLQLIKEDSVDEAIIMKEAKPVQEVKKQVMMMIQSVNKVEEAKDEPKANDVKEDNSH